MNLLMQAEIFSITGQGKLRVTYNWLYSALNCDPNNNSAFVWNIYQANNNTIAMSPQSGYNNMTLYASVRDDWDYYVQVQAPHSADWITAAQRDEFIGLQMLDLGLAKLTGFNGQYIGVLDQPDSGNIRTNGKDTGTHTGYRLRSTYGSSAKEAMWFMKGVGNNIASSSVMGRIGVPVSSINRLLAEDVSTSLQAALQQQGISLSAQQLATLIQQINA